MHGTIPLAVQAAISSSPGSGIDAVPEAGLNPGSGTDDDWFYNVAVTVFGGKETGLHLHLATDWPRTSCYAFVAREPSQRRKPPVEFLRILFRSAHGQPFHAAFMHGCEAPWWADLQRDRHNAAELRKLDLR